MQLLHLFERIKLSRLQADLILLLVTFIWGWTFLVMKNVVSVFPVFPFLTLRFALAFLTLLPLVWPRLRLLSIRQVRASLLTGLFLLLGYSFQTWGLKYTTVSKSGFITGLYVVLVPVLAILFLRRLPTRSAVVGLALATIGLSRLSIGPDWSISLGDFLTLLGALAYAAHIVTISRFGTEIDVLPYAALQVAVVVTGSALFGLFTGEVASFSLITFDIFKAALLTGVIATALVLVLQTMAQRFTSPTQTAVIFTMEPVFAALFGYIFAGDRLSASAWLGGGMIISGMLAAEIGETVFEKRGRQVVSG